MSEVQVLKDMLESNAFDRNRLLSILESFGDDIALMSLSLLKGQKIIRTRINENNLFYHLADLSYPPATCVKRTDRASLKGCPMFYASVFTKDAEESGCLPRIVSALETIALFKEKNATEYAIFTQSAWFVKEPIHVFAFPFSEKYKRSCFEIGMFREDWDKYCKDHYTPRSIEFFSYIGDLMAIPQQSYLYDITATCVDYIIHKMGFEGVAYPSVPVEGEGLNICLTPRAVDAKVSFDGAVTEVVFRCDMQSEIISFAHTRMVSPSSFVWVVSEEGKHIMRMTDSCSRFNPGDEVILCPESAFFF